MLTLHLIQKIVNDQWNAPRTPIVEMYGPQCRLIQSDGKFVPFDLMRNDLKLTPDEFAKKIIAPAIAALRNKENTNA